MSGFAYMDENYRNVAERVEAAARRAGREVTLLAAVKYTDAEHIRYLHRELGVADMGENRAQQLVEHAEALTDCPEICFHFIGKLQANKAKYVAEHACMLHSLDSLKLAAELQRQLEKRGKELDVLVEICDRILVVCAGRVTGVLDGRNTTKEEIGLLMTKSDHSDDTAEAKEETGNEHG